MNKRNTYIEFRLPSGAGGMAAAHYHQRIKKIVTEWADQNNYSIDNWTLVKQHQPYLCISFNSEAAYTLFALTFDSTVYNIPKWVLVSKK